MKKRIVFAIASLAALALPAMADDGYRFRDRDRDRTVIVQNYVTPRYAYDPPVVVVRDRDHDRDDRYRRDFNGPIVRFERDRR